MGDEGRGRRVGEMRDRCGREGRREGDRKRRRGEGAEGGREARKK